ncbi:MAG: hypothetical protein R3B45_12870 [Bdellovibrionota bacterium]
MINYKHKIISIVGIFAVMAIQLGLYELVENESEHDVYHYYCFEHHWIEHGHANIAKLKDKSSLATLASQLVKSEVIKNSAHETCRLFYWNTKTQGVTDRHEVRTIVSLFQLIALPIYKEIVSSIPIKFLSPVLSPPGLFSKF